MLREVQTFLDNRAYTVSGDFLATLFLTA